MLTISTADGVVTITLDRAERGNALSAPLVERLIDAVERASSRSQTDAHTIVLRGSGPHFCTGFDLGELDASSDGQLLLRFVRIELLLALLWHAPLQTIAVARGRTWGAGADLFVACDRRITMVDATFRFPGAAFGVVLGTRRLTERIGAEHAFDIVSRSRELGARQALDLGLAGEICADDDLDRRLAQLAVAPVAERDTGTVLRAAPRADRRDSDIADLVRSAARPGLKQRLVAYREAQLAARKPTPTEPQP